MLDMDALPSESSQNVFNWIISILNKHGLLFENLSAFCDDNSSINFGGQAHRGQNNIFYRLKGILCIYL